MTAAWAEGFMGPTSPGPGTGAFHTLAPGFLASSVHCALWPRPERGPELREYTHPLCRGPSALNCGQHLKDTSSGIV